jgi:hypothetical protein
MGTFPIYGSVPILKLMANFELFGVRNLAFTSCYSPSTLIVN